MNRVDDAQKSKLRLAAKEAADFAYAPYSQFRVGAAVLWDDGSIDTGCNVENASYGLTICAERNAIAKGISRGRKSITYVVVFTPTEIPTPPCGACRQVINEFGPAATVECVGVNGDSVTKNVGDLLPYAFGPGNL